MKKKRGLKRIISEIKIQGVISLVSTLFSVFFMSYIMDDIQDTRWRNVVSNFVIPLMFTVGFLLFEYFTGTIRKLMGQEKDE